MKEEKEYRSISTPLVDGWNTIVPEDRAKAGTYSISIMVYLNGRSISWMIYTGSLIGYV
jgi:hypothetical protein